MNSLTRLRADRNFSNKIIGTIFFIASDKIRSFTIANEKYMLPVTSNKTGDEVTLMKVNNEDSVSMNEAILVIVHHLRYVDLWVSSS